MNPKHTTRARRSAAPSTGPAHTTDGAAGVAAPTAPMVPNAGEGITTGADTTHAPDRSQLDRGAIVRAILSTLAADTAAALVTLLVRWFRAIVAVESSPASGDAVTDDAVQAAADIGAEEHARAVVAAFMVDGMHDTARAAADTRAVRLAAADALNVLGALVAPINTSSAPSSTTCDEAHRALVRTILATVDISVRVAVLRALAAWWRALVVLSIEGERALETARRAHDALESAAPWNVGAACVAVWSGAGCEEMHRTAAGNGVGSTHFIAEVSAPALEDIAVMLGELGSEPPPPAAACVAVESTSSADGLDGSRGAAVLRKCLAGDVPPGVRSRLAVSLMNAATASEHPRAALAAEAAVLVARDEGADPRHTLHLLFIAASEAAQLVRRASIEGARGARVDATPSTLRVVARLVTEELRTGVEALNIAVTALDAFGGAQ